MAERRLAAAALQSQLDDETNQYKAAAEEERFRSARLEEQINDMSELQHHELSNVKQELQSMEEKIEYQLEERTRDMQELLDECHSKVSFLDDIHVYNHVHVRMSIGFTISGSN